jgi:uroporphyrinogen decarboxylase
MTSRERVLAALDHREPDQVPIDCGGTICSTLTRTAHNKVKTHLGIETPDEPVTHPVLDTVVPCDELLERWQIDFRAVRMRPPGAIDDDSADTQGFAATSAAVVLQPRGHEFSDEFGTVWRKADFDYAPVKYAFAEFTYEDLKNFTWPDPYDPGRIHGLEEEARALKESTDFIIVGDIMCGGPFEQACWTRGYSRFLTDLYSDKKFARKLLDGITELDIGFWDVYLSAIGDHVQIVAQGDDLGMQDREYISPEMYKEFIFPCHKRIFDFIKSKTKAKRWLHSCGSIRGIIPHLIEAGVEVLNPIQSGARNMEVSALKRDFGNDISFYGGGFDVQHMLEDDVSVGEIQDAIRRNIDTLAPDGGFVFACTHNVQHEAPPEKVLAIYDTAVENRRYSS